MLRDRPCLTKHFIEMLACKPRCHPVHKTPLERHSKGEFN